MPLNLYFLEDVVIYSSVSHNEVDTACSSFLLVRVFCFVLPMRMKGETKPSRRPGVILKTKVALANPIRRHPVAIADLPAPRRQRQEQRSRLVGRLRRLRTGRGVPQELPDAGANPVGRHRVEPTVADAVQSRDAAGPERQGAGPGGRHRPRIRRFVLPAARRVPAASLNSPREIDPLPSTLIRYRFGFSIFAGVLLAKKENIATVKQVFIARRHRVVLVESRSSRPTGDRPLSKEEKKTTESPAADTASGATINAPWKPWCGLFVSLSRSS